LEKELQNPEVWKTREKAIKISQEFNQCKKEINDFNSLEKELEFLNSDEKLLNLKRN